MLCIYLWAPISVFGVGILFVLWISVLCVGGYDYSIQGIESVTVWA